MKTPRKGEYTCFESDAYCILIFSGALCHNFFKRTP